MDNLISESKTNINNLKGRWIERRLPWWIHDYKCSLCGGIAEEMSDVCPNCNTAMLTGADIIKKGDGHDRN